MKPTIGGTDRLLPCPFCGNEKLRVERADPYQVVCGCGAVGPPAWTADITSLLWNVRYPEMPGEAGQCPWCGNMDTHLECSEGDEEEDDIWSGVCDCCDALGPWGGSREEAAQAWNERAE